MNPSPMVRVNQFLRGSVPVLLSLLLVLLGSLPFGLPYFSILCPLFAVMSVYYWSIYRPDLMPLGAAFLIGFFVDVLSGGPMGLMALVLVLVQAMVASQRRAFLGKSFAVGWWGFGLVATGAVLLTWLISSVFFTQILDPLPAMGQLTISIAVYPLALMLFGSVQRALLPVIQADVMERESSRHKLFSRRAAFLVGGKLALLGVIGGRMYYLQVLERDQYQMLAEENRINLRLLPPPRGRILDRFGEELAKNRQNFRVVLIPEQTSDVGETVSQLGEIVEIQEHQLRRIERELKRQRRFMPLTLVENLTWEQFASVNVKLPDLPGVQPDVGETRYYPYGDSLAHVVGYVSAVSEKDLTGDPLLELPGFRIGKNGIEKIYDESLRGKAGNSRVEVNAYGRVIRELQRQDGQPGDELVLTIDVDLQQAVSRRLAGESASAVVMDVHTGEVLAMVSSPSYDPNAFNLGFSAKSWQALVSNPRNPLTNKAIAGQYPPGSTFKMIVALAALESGVITPEHRTFCNGSTKLGRHRFHCWRWRYGGHGWNNLYEAIEQSCDIFFYDIAKKVGVELIADMARKFGMGERLDVDLVGQRAGLVPDKAWKQATTGVPWQTGETLITGIGQGYLLTTPLQLAVMTARLSNGGFAVQPRLVREKAGISGGEFAEPPASPPSMGISSGSLNAVLKGMRMVVHGRHGTARTAKLENDVKMAGKTGTAQVRRITKAERASGVRKAEEKPWEERAHGLFVAYAPAERPRYALSLVVEHGGSGAKAARMARDIMAEVLDRDPLRRPAIGKLASQRRTGGQGQAMSMGNTFGGPPEMTIAQKLRDVNWLLVLLIIAVACVGFAMLYSAANGSFNPWASRQMARFGAGMVAMLIIAVTDIRIWLRYAYVIYGLGLVLLIAVEVMGFVGMGAQRWVDFGFFQLQPSEVMKIALVLALARYFHGIAMEDIGRLHLLIVPLLMIVIPVVLVIRQPDLGTAILMMMVGGAVFFVAGIRLWKFALAICCAVAAVPIGWQFLRDYQKERIFTFINPERDPLGAGYHITQSKIALGSGGISGKGFMQGTQSHLNFLPERQTDFIFTMLAEEFGLIGCLGLIGLYVCILAYGVGIAVRSRSQFGRILAMGLTTTFFLYVFINIAMVTGLIPVVGVPLPLVSYGGTAMMTLLISFGFLISVYVHRDLVIPRRPV